MLQAKELRLGNKVYNQKGEVITVQQILCSSIIYDTQMQINADMANVGGGYEISYSSQISYSSHVIEFIEEAEYEEIEPIVLTPDILEKCGFRNFMREEWIIRFGNSHADFEFTGAGLQLRHAPHSRVIKYLHHLQNFFFAMTGYELEVNL